MQGLFSCSMALLYIADHFTEDLNGGAEQNDAALLQALSNWMPVWRLRCRQAKASVLFEWLNDPSRVVLLGNCSQLSHKCKQALSEYAGRYCLIEHDHHYLQGRNPCLYPQGVAPTSQRANQVLFQHAQAVLCQSSLHKKCIFKNTTDTTIVNLGCNFWAAPWLEALQQLRKSEKRDVVAVQASQASIKNSNGALQWCRDNHIPAELIPALPYPLFLQALSQAKGLVFHPLWVESFSRLSMEAALLGLKIHGNANIGVLQENWFMQHQTNGNTWDASLFETLKERQRNGIAIVKHYLMRCIKGPA
jgi:hypothetical protein